jgi:hypothetical protein
MNLEELERKLVATARAHPPGDQVPYAFAKRVMARLPARREVHPGAGWARALWRGAMASLTLVLFVGVLSLFLPQRDVASTDLTQDFEQTMLAALDQDTDYLW